MEMSFVGLSKLLYVTYDRHILVNILLKHTITPPIGYVTRGLLNKSSFHHSKIASYNSPNAVIDTQKGIKHLQKISI